MSEDTLTRIYRLFLRLYPSDHRRIFSDEMAGVFKQSLVEARHKGRAAVLTLLLRELFYLPVGLAQAYAHSWRQWQPAQVSAPGWPWALGWAAGTTVAIPLAYLLAAPLAGALLLLLRLAGAGGIVDPNVLRAFGFLLALAFLLATVQWTFLRRRLPGAGWWFGATFAGWLLSGAVVGASMFALTRLNVAVPVWFWMVVPLTLGLFIGICQMLVLRRVTSRAAWWVVIHVLAFATIILSGNGFASIAELLFFMALPGAVSAAGLWLLLRQAVQQPRVSKQAAVLEKRPLRRRPALLVFLLVSLIALCALTPWAYAVGQLELAKSEGVYASPEEAIVARHSEGWGGARVVDITNVRAGPSRRDGRFDHIWFGGAQITFDRIPLGGRHISYSTGSYYLHVRDGWVHVAEGAFPQLVGWLMEVYNLEGQ